MTFAYEFTLHFSDNWPYSIAFNINDFYVEKILRNNLSLLSKLNNWKCILFSIMSLRNFLIYKKKVVVNCLVMNPSILFYRSTNQTVIYQIKLIVTAFSALGVFVSLLLRPIFSLLRVWGLDIVIF